jgi:hypothetical protein
MIDIETAATDSKAVVLTVGAVMFFMGSENIQIAATIYHNLNIEEQRFKLLRSWDEETLAWWQKQSPKTREEAFKSSELEVSKSLGLLSAFMGHADEYWANSPSFDLDILSSLYRDCGLQNPFPFRMQRDFRTLTALYQDLTGAKFKRTHSGSAHNALDDAENQARDLFTMLKELKGKQACVCSSAVA